MAKAKNQEELQADLEKLKAKEKALKARIRAAQARESAAVRKKRNHALMTLGSWCEIACGGDWTAIDWGDVHDMLMKYSGNYKKTAKHSRNATEANDALREYERELRTGGKAEALADAAEAAVADAVEDLGESSHKRGINIEALCGLDVDMDEDD